MRFQLLGPVAAFDDRGRVELGSAKQRTVLAILLVDLGSPVSLDQMVDRVWGPSPPRSARRTLHSYLSRLRGRFADAGGAVLTSRRGIYTLEVEKSNVDIHNFRMLAAGARRQADDNRSAALWHEALALWRGAPFADLDNDWLRTIAIGLEGEFRAAKLDHTDLLLRQGEHQRLLPELTTAATENPLDERLAGQLMLALYGCRRQPDALSHYRLLRERLVEELGSDPGPELRVLHQRILRQDPELAVPPAPPVRAEPPPGVVPRPAQLPADVAGFRGRAADLRRLDELLPDSSDGEPAHPVVITAIGGTAGVGKTALAVHWAHRVADRFPDGQLYVNLRGYDPEQPLSPAAVLARFLTALGVTGQNIPLELDERAARFRSEIAGRRMLIVLDNAGGVAQVRPLLPGSGSSLVLVTSRDNLAGLVAVHGARRVDLDLLPADEAIDLLRQLIGTRVETDPEAAAALAEQCVRLPLALRVAAELAASRPADTLAELVAELADRQARLDLLDSGGDPYAAVRAVFSWSMQHLPPEAVRAFRLLGLHPGPDLEPHAAAALTGTDPDQARRMLETLARSHLVHRCGPGRYGMHDLLRAYAIHLTAIEEDESERAAAHRRMLDFYQAAAVAAMDVLHPAEAHYRPAVSVSAAIVPDLSEPHIARAWLDSERTCLVAITAHAAAIGRPDCAVGLARILHRYLAEANPTELVAINTHARRAAERAGDTVGEAHALRQLGTAYTRLAQHSTAMEYNDQALIRFQRAGDLVGQALSWTNIGVTAYRMGDHKRAIDEHQQAIDIARQNGDRLSEAFVLTNLAVVHERLGKYVEAAEHSELALALFRELGSRYCEAVTLSNLANVELRQGKYALAADHVRQSLALVKRLGTLIPEAHSLDTLGILHLRLDDPEAAAEHFQQALDRYRQTGERNGQAWAVNGLGEAAQLAGDPMTALSHHTEALNIATETGSRHQQARADAGLGNAYRAQGEIGAARSHYESSLATYLELDMPEAEEVRAWLAQLGPEPGGTSHVA